MAQKWDVEGKTCLITGGASGLGASYAEAFLTEGAKKIAILDIAEDQGKATTSRLNGIRPNSVIFIKCDVSDEDSITHAFEEVLSAFKHIDVIVNNAGIMDESPGVWRTMCDINYKGLISFTMKGLQHMRKDKGGAGGTIINISSRGALKTVRSYFPMYRGSKMAVLHFSQCLATQPSFSNTEVRILTLCPGLTETAMAKKWQKRGFDEDICEEVKAHEKGYMQGPKSVAEAMIEIFKKGKNASIWVIAGDKPAQDITYIFDNLFEQLKPFLS